MSQTAEEKAKRRLEIERLEQQEQEIKRRQEERRKARGMAILTQKASVRQLLTNSTSPQAPTPADPAPPAPVLTMASIVAAAEKPKQPLPPPPQQQPSPHHSPIVVRRQSPVPIRISVAPSMQDAPAPPPSQQPSGPAGGAPHSPSPTVRRSIWRSTSYRNLDGIQPGGSMSPTPARSGLAFSQVVEEATTQAKAKPREVDVGKGPLTHTQSRPLIQAPPAGSLETSLAQSGFLKVPVAVAPPPHVPEEGAAPVIVKISPRSLQPAVPEDQKPEEEAPPSSAAAVVAKELQDFTERKYIEMSKMSKRLKELEEEITEAKKRTAQLEEIARAKEREIELLTKEANQQKAAAAELEERKKRKAKMATRRKISARAMIDFLQPPAVPGTVDDFIHMLNDEGNFRLTLVNVLRLKHLIKTADRDWVTQFVGHRGLQALTKVIAELHKPRKDMTPLAAMVLQHCLVLCIKALSNTPDGLDVISGDMTCVHNLVVAIQSSRNLAVQAQVLELCASLIVYSREGEQAVHRAIEGRKGGSSTQRAMKYDFVVRWMKNEDWPQLPRACLMFVNAFVNASRSLSKRTARRDVFLSLRITDVLEPMRAKDTSGLTESALASQAEVFFTRMADDVQQLKELQSQLHVDVTSLPEVSKAISTNVAKTEAEPFALNVLQHLLVLPTDARSTAAWEFVQTAVHKGLMLGEAKYVEHDVVDQLIKNYREKIAAEKKSAAPDGTGLDRSMRTSLRLSRRFVQPLKDSFESGDPPKQATETTPPPPLSLPSLSPSSSDRSMPPSPLPLVSDGSRTPPPPPTMPAPPPPPPPPSSGIPAPPPPPGAPAPPPPLPGPSPRRSTAAATKRLQRVFWVKVPEAQISETLWTKKHLSDTSQVNLDTTKLEDLFAAVPRKPAGSSRATSRPEREFVSLLEAKRSNGIGILLSQLKRFSLDSLKELVMAGNVEPFTIENLESLHKFAPEAAEVELVTTYSSAAEGAGQLGKPEQFVLMTAGIPRYKNKIEAMLFQKTFPQKMAALYDKIGIFEQAITQVENADRFHRVLGVILAVGNHLNSGTDKGNAGGFKLAALKKLSETKSATNQQVTLLHFIIDHVRKEYKELAGFPDQLGKVKEAADLSLQETKEEIDKMCAQVATILDEIEQLHQDSGEFFDTMEKFLRPVQVETEAVRDKCESLAIRAGDMLGLFGEDPLSDKSGEDKDPLKTFLTAIHEFAAIWDTTVKEVVKAEQRLIERAKKEEREKVLRDQREKEKETKKEQDPAALVPAVPVAKSRRSTSTRQTRQAHDEHTEEGKAVVAAMDRGCYGRFKKSHQRASGAPSASSSAAAAAAPAASTPAGGPEAQETGGAKVRPRGLTTPDVLSGFV